MKKDRLATGGGLIEMGSNRNDILFGSGAPVKDCGLPLKRAQCSPIWSQLFENSSIAPFNSSHAIYLKSERIRPITGVKQTGTHLSLGSLEKGADPGSKGGFWPAGPQARAQTPGRADWRDLCTARLGIGAHPPSLKLV